MLTNDIRQINKSKFLKGKILRGENLSKHTTMKVGGITPIWFVPFDIGDLINFLNYCDINKLKIMVLGNGSNVVIKDDKLDMVFLNLSSSYFKKIVAEKNKVTVRAGTNLIDVIEFSKNISLSGLEYFTLIPGTIGGAITTNVSINFNGGIYKFSDKLNKITILDIKTKEFKTILVNKSNFGDIKFENKILIEAELSLTYDRNNTIAKRMKIISDYRKKTQDYTLPSCGCIFKNPLKKNISAGEMIQKSGLKGVRIGNAMISLKHANFIVNCGNACYKDILNLIKLTQQRVYEHYGIRLEEEIEIIR